MSVVARRSLVLSYLGFISLGLPDTVLGAAWPALRAELGLPLDAAGSLLLVTTAGVVVSSAANHALRARLGTGGVLVGSTLLAAGALLGTAAARGFLHLLAAAFAAGLGGGAIDAALNDHVARNYPARQLSWLHACWGVGAALAPLGVACVLSAGASWRLAYGALALIEASLASAFFATRALWHSRVEHDELLSHTPHDDSRWPMLASVALFFVYGGLEAGTGLWISSVLIGARGSTAAKAGMLVGGFWAALTVGRVAAGLRADAIGPARLLRASSWLALAAAVVLALPETPTWFFAAALLALGLALAPVYPLAMHDTPARFGSVWGARLVGYQVAAASLGVATLPWLMGRLAVHTSVATLPSVFVGCALAIVCLQRARLRARST